MEPPARKRVSPPLMRWKRTRSRVSLPFISGLPLCPSGSRPEISRLKGPCDSSQHSPFRLSGDELVDVPELKVARTQKILPDQAQFQRLSQMPGEPRVKPCVGRYV